LKARINLRSAFDRKNYFYPTCRRATRISQLYAPLVGEGEVLVEVGGATRNRSESSASTSSRTAARASTTWTPSCPSWTSTAPEWR
jgi:Asp-tRNA(Asn)/Glu-tRNA(Gln) amidotransferase B subunit